MSFKSLRIMSCQFCRGVFLHGFLLMLLRFQFKAWSRRNRHSTVLRYYHLYDLLTPALEIP